MTAIAAAALSMAITIKTWRAGTTCDRLERRSRCHPRTDRCTGPQQRGAAVAAAATGHWLVELTGEGRAASHGTTAALYGSAVLKLRAVEFEGGPTIGTVPQHRIGAAVRRDAAVAAANRPTIGHRRGRLCDQAGAAAARPSGGPLLPGGTRPTDRSGLALWLPSAAAGAACPSGARGATEAGGTAATTGN